MPKPKMALVGFLSASLRHSNAAREHRINDGTPEERESTFVAERLAALDADKERMLYLDAHREPPPFALEHHRVVMELRDEVRQLIALLKEKA